ncbi:hypothetical protein TVAG_488650 [Trichomonas vaginalis G3]|uniref:Condensation domain-containing protein n=1 Tax=Trichomonas vaginalis (strain ATCC PRA-98 / G3) TaxID=412133 RepID=A2FXE8_TRIV3|nr:hypothetical protein TVAGG3_0432350 [Trichomonas vaginalis G3]EAX90411.1 hypothetical protein TVAG_488650 [Trichomonas vaginalis G3]KAI5536845.1 hypothetical protein TVAGG3_0432350 [Trichomonas vaginalis G3]|eukprot:XP_001303341.1 hypothetical protein [Trichomonas vaginalis G3]
MRAAIGWERNFLRNRAYVQLGLKINNSASLERNIQKIINSVSGFHVKVSDWNLLPTKEKTPVYKLPSTLKTLDDACKFMYKNHTRPMTEALASIGANNDTIVLNINHAAADGMFLVSLLNYLNKHENEEVHLPEIFESVDYVFDHEIKSYNGVPAPFNTVNPNLSRIIAKDTLHLAMDNTSHHTSASSNLANFKCYNPKTKSVHHLTENLWSSIILTISAFNGNFNTKGCGTCIDLRRFMKVQPDFRHCNIFSSITVNAEATKDTSVGEFMKILRSDFNSKVKSGFHFGYLKQIQEGKIPPIGALPGVGADMSSLGTFKVGGDITDAWFNIALRGDRALGSSTFTCFTVDNGINQTFHGRLRHSSFTLSDYDAQVYVDSIHHALENITDDMSCGLAIDILSDFQKKNSKSNLNDIVMF